MPRPQWVDLPEQLRGAVEERFGAVTETRSAGPGFTSGVAARLDTEAGAVFLKAIPESDRAAGSFVLERDVNRSLPPDMPAPRLLWDAHVQGWLVMAFECVDGREPDLSPGSADLPAIIKTVGQITTELTPCPWLEAPPMAREVLRWQRKAAPILEAPGPGLAGCTTAMDALDFGALSGDTLLHADLHAMNILVGDDVRILDWGLACRGAAWIEVTLFASRLIAQGHTPERAELLVSGLPGWVSAPGQAVTGLIAVRALFAEYLTRYGPERLRTRRQRTVEACRAWVSHRTG
ncbi:MAG: aminoglycoside phosphotransferase [Gemmatimonadales bacterium]|nr:aminoglycoside phosphotransferase [Gemmatimonadales bacterium]